MHDVQGAEGLSLCDDAGDADFAGACRWMNMNNQHAFL